MRNLHYLPKLTLIFSRPELMAIHMQDNNLSNVESEKYSSETINIWPSTSSAWVIPSGCENKQKKKGKKVLGLENFPSIIEVLNPNDLFDEKSKIFPKLFSHKSSLFNIEGDYSNPKNTSVFWWITCKNWTNFAIPFWVVHQFCQWCPSLGPWRLHPEGCNNADIRRMNGSEVSHCTTSSSSSYFSNSFLEKCIPFHLEVKQFYFKHLWKGNHKGLLMAG